MKYLISIFAMILITTTSCFSQSYSYPVQSDASGKINGWNTYKQANDIASGADLTVVSNGITTELHSVSNYFEVRLDNTAQNYSVVSNKAMNSVQDLDAGDDMRIASTEKLSLHSDKALSIQSEEVIHIFSANGVQVLDLQADSLIITNNPTATNGVGNRGYNDGRYLLQTSTNAVIAEAVKQAEGAGSLSTVVLLTGEKTPTVNGSEFRTAMTTANVAGKQTLILVGDGDYLFTSDWNPTIVSNAIITIVAVHRNPVTRVLSQGCEPTGFIPKARFYGTTKYKFYMSGACSYKGIFFDNLNVYFNYSATDVADIEDLVMTKESFGSHCDKMTMKRVYQKEEDCLSYFYTFLSGNYENIYSESSLYGNSQSLVNGIFKNCVGGDDSFGNNITDSIFTDCSGGDNCFGSYITDSTFKNCSGSGNFCFGNYITNSTFTSCSSGGNGSFGYTSAKGCTFTGCVSGENSFGPEDLSNSVFKNCKARKKSFGAYVDNCVFTDCVAGEDSFGGKNNNFHFYQGSFEGTPLGTFNNSFATNCIGGEHSFGVKEIENSVFIRCQSANDTDNYVFCGYESFVSNVFEKCVASTNGSYGFSFGGYDITESTFESCVGGDSSFGAYNDITGSTFESCSGGDYSFGGNNDITGSTFESCVGGDSSFGGNDNITGSTFESCSGGDDSFGGNDITGSIFTDCSGGDNCFGKTTGGTVTPTLIKCIGGANCFGNASTNYWCLGPSNSGLSASDVSDRGCIIK